MGGSKERNRKINQKNMQTRARRKQRETVDKTTEKNISTRNRKEERERTKEEEKR